MGNHVSSREKTSADSTTEIDGGAVEAGGEHQQDQRESGETDTRVAAQLGSNLKTAGLQGSSKILLRSSQRGFPPERLYKSETKSV